MMILDPTSVHLDRASWSIKAVENRLRGSTALPFVISTEAKRSGEISVWMLSLGNVFDGILNRTRLTKRLSKGFAHRFRPTYAGANMGHPYGVVESARGLWGRAVVSHISRKTSEMWGTRLLRRG
jgi:hypothetical protein